MWAFFTLYWISYNIASVFCLSFGAWGMWDLSFPTRDGIHTHCVSLGGRILTTGSPGKSLNILMYCEFVELL